MSEFKDSKKIELVFPETEFRLENKPAKRGVNEKILHSFSTSLDEITNWFSKYNQVN